MAELISKNTNGVDVLITGASGMLGSALSRVALARGLELAATSRDNRYSLPQENFHHCDLLDLTEAEKLVGELKPKLLINCAAITDHSACEREESLCRRLHVESTGLLASLQAYHGGRFVHISTEAVYGAGGGPHSEQDAPHPCGVYAVTKEAGESAALAANSDAIVLRVTPVGFRPDCMGKSLTEWIVRSLFSGDTINGYSDVFFSPISSDQIAQFVFDPKINSLKGIYNLCSEPVVSKFEFAQSLATALDFDAGQVTESLKFDGEGLHQGGMEASKLQQDFPSWKSPSFLDVISSLKQQYLNLKTQFNYDEF